MTKYIYFLRTKDATKFKIGKAKCLQARYNQLINLYGDIFDIESSFYLFLPENANLSSEEKAFHRAFRDFQVDPGDPELFRIEVYYECIDRAAALRDQKAASVDLWTVHSTADFFKLRRSKSAERLVQKLIGLGHEHLAQHMPQMTKDHQGKESMTVWLPRGIRRWFKMLRKDEADGIDTAEGHYTRAIGSYIDQMNRGPHIHNSSQQLIIEYAKKIRKREDKTAEAVTFKLPVGFKKSIEQLTFDECDGLKTDTSHITRALCCYLYQPKWAGIEQSKLAETWRADVEGRS